jgi:hypothetical protein
MKDSELKALIDKGYVLCRIIFEMAGNPKEHVEKTFKEYIKAVKEDPEYIFTKEYMSPPEERDDGVWSMFYESEVVIASLEKLSILCLNLGPASIEILQPEQMTLTDKKLTEIYNDFASKLHEIGIVVKNVSGENEVLKINLNRAIRNCVVLALIEPKTASEIAEKVGVDAENLQPFLDAMVREKSLVKDGEKYHKKS